MQAQTQTMCAVGGVRKWSATVQQWNSLSPQSTLPATNAIPIPIPCAGVGAARVSLRLQLEQALGGWLICSGYDCFAICLDFDFDLDFDFGFGFVACGTIAQ